MKKSAVFPLIALAGCATILTDEQATAEVQKFKGRPVADLVSRLGDQPVQRFGDGRMEFERAASGRAYVWRLTNVVGYGVKTYCALEAVVDNSGIVRTLGMDGNRGGCHEMARRAGDLK